MIVVFFGLSWTWTGGVDNPLMHPRMVIFTICALGTPLSTPLVHTPCPLQFGYIRNVE